MKHSMCALRNWRSDSNRRSALGTGSVPPMVTAPRSAAAGVVIGRVYDCDEGRAAARGPSHGPQEDRHHGRLELPTVDVRTSRAVGSAAKRREAACRWDQRRTPRRQASRPNGVPPPPRDRQQCADQGSPPVGQHAEGPRHGPPGQRDGTARTRQQGCPPSGPPRAARGPVSANACFCCLAESTTAATGSSPSWIARDTRSKTRHDQRPPTAAQ